MKRLSRFFSLALLTVITLITMALHTFAASLDFAAIIEEWGTGVIIVVAIVVILVIVLIARAASKSKQKASVKAPEAPAASEEASAEKATEEVAVADAPAEEVVKEEAPAAKEAPVAEEVPAAEEAPVVEEAPAVKPEPVCEFPELADDYAAEAKEIPAEAVDPETGCTYTFNENGIPVPPEGKVIRYKWSFLGRLSQAHPEVKYHYLTLRRTLLAYAKMRSNVSWNFDSYFVGRKTVAKLKIRGKNLVVYFPIDPKEMEGTKYVGEDASGISRYKAVPFAYAINGTRKLKYAIELIEKLMESKPASAPVLVDEADVNTYVPEKDFDTLYKRDLIRIGGFLSVGASAPAEDDE